MKNEKISVDDPRLTAYALGELERSEREELEAQLATRPELEREVNAVRELASRVRVDLRNEPQHELDSSRRNRIIEPSHALDHARKANRVPRPVQWFAGLVAASVLLALGSFLVWIQPDGEGSRSPERRVSVLEDLGALGYTDGSPGRGEPTIHLSPDQLSVLDELAYAGDGALRDLGYSGTSVGAQGNQRRHQSPSIETYSPIRENRFHVVADEPLSTFSIDVDTASYANVRRFLNAGTLPPADAVRVEELINYFDYAYALPTGPEPFATSVEVGGCPWAPAHRLVRIGLKGSQIAHDVRRGKNLVFLIDVSGSMGSPDKLPLLVRSMRLLVDQLDADDRIAIVVYAGSSGLVLPSTSCAQRDLVLRRLDELSAGGSTNGGEGIRLAYRTARESFLEGGVNRVLLATDGDFNVGITQEGDLLRLIEEEARSGVFLSVLGFGTGNLKDSQMEQLADHGNGNYAYIDSLHEARKVLVREIGGTLETIAKDVKIQVEFNPKEVSAFRLIGYENRVLEHRDFNDDTKDAGEIGSGHTVTALYEVVPAGVAFPGAPGVDPLKYQDAPRRSSPAATTGELLTVKLRYKEPDGDRSRLIEVPVRDGGASFAAASEDFRFAAAVAAFGLCLRASEHRGTATLADVYEWAFAAAGPDPYGYRQELLRLVAQAERLGR